MGFHFFVENEGTINEFIEGGSVQRRQLPFAGVGIEAVTIASFGRASPGIHTSRDTPDRLSEDALERAGGLALAAIQRIERLRE